MGDGLYYIYKAIQILMKEGIGSNPIIQLKKVIQISENVMIFFSFSFQVSLSTADCWIFMQNQESFHLNG